MSDVNELLARYNAECQAITAKGKTLTQSDVNKFFEKMTDILGDLIVIVAEHERQPFTKAHDKGRDT